ncbi:MAG: hypothetical protein KGL46_04760 [Hyphomicrobiales bacterium]|nr:hypothetical protein [Hyphomicrobiales bacterium]
MGVRRRWRDPHGMTPTSRYFLGLALAPALAASAPVAGSAQSFKPPTARSVAAAVARSGAAVIWTSPTTYERFVRDSGSCGRNDDLAPFWDKSGNFIGKICHSHVDNP